MTPDPRWERVAAIVAEALERGETERAAYVDEACAGDAELRNEVESLLGFEPPSSSFLEAPAVRVAAEMITRELALPDDEREIGPYTLGRLLGTGGMGSVYEAYDPRLERSVAVKLIAPSFLEGADWVSLLQQEAKTASALNHPSVVTIHEIGQSGDRHYIVSELIEGKTLRARLDGGQLAIDEVLDVVAQLASALEVAHEAGIVHRDLKPENVMIRPDGLVKILDFGLATWTDRKSAEEILAIRGEGDRERATGVVEEGRSPDSAVGSGPTPILGSVAYMSPEQTRGAPCDPRADLFALGVVLYELATGRVPFRGATLGDVAMAIQLEAPVPPSRHRPEIAPALERTILRLLAKDPDERFQNARSLLSELDGSRRGASSAAVSSPSPAEEAARAAAGRVGRGAAAILLLLSVAIGYRLFRSEPVTEAPASTATVAVLDFENRTSEPGLDYLADGIENELRETLGALADVEVKTAGQSAMGWRDWLAAQREDGPFARAEDTLPQKPLELQGRDLALLGDELAVGWIVRGALVDAEEGYRLELVVNPVPAGQPVPVVAESALSELVAAQRQAAIEVARAIGSRETLPRRVVHEEAQQRYLEGRYELEKRTVASLRAAIEHFEAAMHFDAEFAPAYAGLAIAYSLFPNYGAASPGASRKKADAAVARALQRGPNSAEAHAAMGLLLKDHDWDFRGARRWFRTAIQAQEDYAPAHQWLAETSVALGEFDEALEQMNRAHELDPFAPIIHAEVGWVLYNARRYDDALAVLRDVSDSEPDFARTYFFRARVLERQGRYEEALAALRRAVELGQAEELVQATEGYTLAQAGRLDEARTLLAELLARSADEYTSTFAIGLLHVGLEQFDEAFRWFDRAVEVRDPILPAYLFDPQLDPIRDDPRYAAVVDRVLSHGGS